MAMWGSTRGGNLHMEVDDVLATLEGWNRADA
jgi:hypothetical protein